MTETYEGQAYDARKGKLVRVAIKGEEFVLAPEETFDLDPAELQHFFECLAEGIDLSPPSNDAPYGELERYHATLAKAKAMLARQRRVRLVGEVEDAKAGHQAATDIRTLEELEKAAAQAEIDERHWSGLARQALAKYRRAMRLRENRMRLGEAVVFARKQRGMTQAEFAKEVQVSLSTMQMIENSDNPHRGMNVRTATSLEAAMGWEIGSVQAILNGGEPTLIGAGTVEGESASAGAFLGRADIPENSGGRISIRLDDDLADALRAQAVAEDRSLSRIIESAARLYLKTMADD